jgi:hypothetical protein
MSKKDSENLVAPAPPSLEVEGRAVEDEPTLQLGGAEEWREMFSKSVNFLSQIFIRVLWSGGPVCLLGLSKFPIGLREKMESCRKTTLGPSRSNSFHVTLDVLFECLLKSGRSSPNLNLG